MFSWGILCSTCEEGLLLLLPLQTQHVIVLLVSLFTQLFQKGAVASTGFMVAVAASPPHRLSEEERHEYACIYGRNP